jgi:hypothetical protein
MAERSKTLTVHVEYGENSEHVVYRTKVPETLGRKLCLWVACGMLFRTSWVLDDSAGHDWSIWLNGECIEAHGRHRDFAKLPENKVNWLYGKPV